MSQSCPVDFILVPHGAEYRAVCQGLACAGTPRPVKVISIPVGPQPVTTFLDTWERPRSYSRTRPLRIVIMGLCGSLSPSIKLGDWVLPRLCVAHLPHSRELLIPKCQQFSSTFSQELGKKLNLNTDRVTLLPESPDNPILLTSDRAICTAADKRSLGQLFQADVIDMEGAAILAALSSFDVEIAMLRVVSDDCQTDLPDLNAALKPDGSLSAFPLAIGMLRHPGRALSLIRGSLRALQELECLTREVGALAQ